MQRLFCTEDFAETFRVEDPVIRKDREEVTLFLMNRRTVKQLAILLIMWVVLGDGLMPGHAEQIQGGAVTLPRSFQGVRLGMGQYDLMAITPELKRTMHGTNGSLQRPLIVLSKDRYLHHVEYRFSRGVLRELAIYYNHDHIPRGYEGLLARLKEAYGQPMTENMEEYDPRPDVFSVKKTVWKDHATMAVLSEVRKIREDQEAYDVVLTLSDLALQQVYEQDQERRRREQELRIPIPLSEQATQEQRAGKPSLKGTQRHSNG